MKTILCLGFALGCLLRANPVSAQDDLQQLQGTWIPTRAELGGQPMTEDVLKSISLNFAGTNWAVYVGDHPDKGFYSIDPTTRPKRMTITGTEGPNHGRTFPAIYDLKRGTLSICYDLSGAKRPVEFKSVAGTKLYLVSYRRRQP